MKNLLKKIGLDGFILSLFGAIFLAWLYPPPGASEKLFSLSTVARYGVTVIFFFYGVRLNWQKIYEGLKNYRLHIVVHLSTFVLFPLLVLPLTWYFTRGADQSTTWLWYGIFFLATLPSTVSSSVVMVNIARGNVPAAIFDASISSLLGVFITPVWMQIFVGASSGERDPEPDFSGHRAGRFGDLPPRTAGVVFRAVRQNVEEVRPGDHPFDRLYVVLPLLRT